MQELALRNLNVVNEPLPSARGLWAAAAAKHKPLMRGRDALLEPQLGKHIVNAIWLLIVVVAMAVTVVPPKGAICSTCKDETLVGCGNTLWLAQLLLDIFDGVCTNYSAACASAGWRQVRRGSRWLASFVPGATANGFSLIRAAAAAVTVVVAALLLVCLVGAQSNPKAHAGKLGHGGHKCLNVCVSVWLWMGNGTVTTSPTRARGVGGDGSRLLCAVSMCDTAPKFSC